MFSLSFTYDLYFEELKYPNPPNGRVEFATSYDNKNNLIVFGGLNDSFETEGDLYLLDISSKKWIKQPNPPKEYSRRCASSVYYKDCIYIFGEI